MRRWQSALCLRAQPRVCVRMRRPRLLSLIDPARRPFDLQDISEPADAAGGGEMAGEMSGKKRRGAVERRKKKIIKNQWRRELHGPLGRLRN